jgi:glycosyltransferase involved in cell wall biosynthesis
MAMSMSMRVAIYHNILWSRYKGQVFSRLYSQSRAKQIDASFVQVAETEAVRVRLGTVDLSYHQYPYRLLFRGSIDEISRARKSFALVRDLLRHPTDLVVMPGYHRVEYWAMLALCLLLRRKRAVFCDATVHDQPRRYLKELAKRIFFRRCDGFFCYGQRSKQYILGYGVEESKINFRVQAAALPHDYDPAKVLAHYRDAKIDFSASPLFLYVGRLSEEKGLKDAFLALKRIRERFPAARLNLVGAGPLKEELAANVRQLGLEGAVSFLGSKDLTAIASLFMTSVALVLPSYSEPWGLVVNEALSYGCPVVVSDHCGCVPELVIDGMTGYTFETANPEALANAMISAIGLSSDRARVAEQCLSAISHFTPERAAAQILDGCTKILNGAA